jgi:uncharacterized membrane protein
MVSFGVAVVVATGAGLLGMTQAAPLIGWDILAAIYLCLAWSTIWPLDPVAAEAEASREDPGRQLTDLVLNGAAVASLAAVGVVLFGAGAETGYLRYLRAGFALASVFVSWTLVHTVYTLKYARLYYGGPGPPGGIDFNDSGPPDYADFAYLAFTIGMTFQVSDTAIQSRAIRRTVLRHAWLSFPFLAVIVAASVNLVSGLAK